MPGDIFHGRPRSIHVAARGTFLVAARATCSMAANEHFYVAAVTPVPSTPTLTSSPKLCNQARSSR